MTFAIDLPKPPSANAMWRHGRGRVYLSKEYKLWIDECSGIFFSLGLNRGRVPIEGRFTSKIFIREGLRLDPDNTIKPQLDLAQRLGVIANDKNLRHLELGYGDIGNDVRLVVEAL